MIFSVYLRLELDLHNPLVQLQDVIMQRCAKLLHISLPLSHRFMYDVMQRVNGRLQGGKSDYILRRVGDSVGSNQIVHLRNCVLLLFQHSYLRKNGERVEREDAGKVTEAELHSPRVP